MRRRRELIVLIVSVSIILKIYFLEPPEIIEFLRLFLEIEPIKFLPFILLVHTWKTLNLFHTLVDHLVNQTREIKLPKFIHIIWSILAIAIFALIVVKVKF